MAALFFLPSSPVCILGPNGVSRTCGGSVCRSSPRFTTSRGRSAADSAGSGTITSLASLYSQPVLGPGVPCTRLPQAGLKLGLGHSWRSAPKFSAPERKLSHNTCHSIAMAMGAVRNIACGPPARAEPNHDDNIAVGVYRSQCRRAAAKSKGTSPQRLPAPGLLYFGSSNRAAAQYGI
ncbi:hypothetical protein IG631_24275 [Alternaria alternata]|nr:hypothetical protein IG631_24275 [Alternaria alternata]